MHIFDIDGTLTHVHGEYADPGSNLSTYVYWDLVNEALIEDKPVLRAYLDDWNNRIHERHPQNVVDLSVEMMNKIIALMPEHASAQAFEDLGIQFTKTCVANGIIREDAMAYVRACLARGERCVFSTGGYYDSAVGLLKGLVAEGVLPEDATSKITVLGSTVAWPTREMSFVNVGPNKTISLQIEVPDWRADETLGFYCDDPEGNDSGLADLVPADTLFVIGTDKNKGVSYPRTDWTTISKG
jgi:hypothetical protein